MLDTSSKSPESRSGRWSAIWIGLILGMVLSTVFQGCAQGVRGAASSAAGASSSGTHNADDLLIVDCLLPAQIRRLGQMMTYMAARQAIKTSGIDCAIRGGEYVAYDRSNYTTALKVWLPLAEAGDKNAQTYVGEIYEKGLGIAPDYTQAASWYRKAAEQGDSRAQINYGYLYEKGLGVKPDPVEALNWYRKASGMSGNIALDTGELQALRQEVEVHKRSEESLRQQLQDTREQLEKAQRELARRRHEAAAEQRRFEEAKQALERQRATAVTQGDSAAVQRLEAQIRQRAAELERQRQETARLEQQAGQYRQQLASLEQQKGHVQALEQEVVRQKGESAALRRQLEDAQDQAAKARQGLEQGQTRASTAEQRVEAARQELEREKQQAASANQAEIKKLEARLASREMELARQQTEVKRLTTEAERYQGRLAALEQERTKETAKPPPAEAKPATSGMASGVPLVGPRIEIIEPPVSLTRGALLTIKTRSGMDRPIVGRVTASAGIRSLQVNGHEEKLDEYGLFRTQVPITRANTPVDVLAIDQQGKRANIQFAFVSEQEAAPAAAAPSRQETEAPLLQTGDFGSYYALVIGNNNYARMPQLDTAVNDAQDIAAVLNRKYGFKVTTLLNANRYQILSALSEMREKLTEDDNLLIYYAGHGELDKVNQRGYWLPVDSEPNSTANWISNVDITDILNVMTIKHVLVVADSCYSGTLTRSALGQLEAGLTRDAKINWLKTMTKKRSRTALTSGGVAPVLDAGGGNHSVFAKALLEVLQDNGDVIDGSRLYREVAARVAYAATRFRMEQVPEYAPIKYAGHDFGDFFLVPAGAKPASSQISLQ